MPNLNWLFWLKNNLYFIGLAMMAIGMPLSKALLSFSLVVLIVAWFVAPGIKNRIQVLKVRKSIWFFLLGYLVVVAGLLYSNNIDHNLYLLVNIKISLIILPIVIGTFGVLTSKQLKNLFLFFTSANFIATIVSFLILFHIVQYEFQDTRQISIFNSSVRFALLIALNVLLLGYVFFKIKNVAQRIFLVLLVMWFLYFLTLLQALTGIIVIIGTLIVILIFKFKQIKLFWRTAILFCVFAGAFATSLYVKGVKNDFYTIYQVDLTQLDSLTINGKPYIHNLSDTTRVNGHLVWIYVCEDELRKEWAKRSTWEFDSLDLIGWIPVKKTLVLYLSSMGLRKDSSGMAQLTIRDIRNIEHGYNNKALATVGLYGRIYDVIREFDTWNRSGKPAGSITIRINALANGWKVFKQNSMLGTGYGDINDDVQLQYMTDNMIFGADMRQNPHNQFLTVLIGAGTIGFIIFLISMIVPCILEKKYYSILFIIAFCVVVLSFLSDDTLERMVGAIITAFTFSLFMYSVSEDEQ